MPQIEFGRLGIPAWDSPPRLPVETKEYDHVARLRTDGQGPDVWQQGQPCQQQDKDPLHANNKSRRRFLPNLNEVTMISDVLGRSFSLRVSAAGIRSVDHRGGLDAYLAKAKDDELSVNAMKIKKEIAKAQAAS